MNSQSSQRPYRAAAPWQQQQPRGAGNMSQSGFSTLAPLPPPPPPPPSAPFGTGRGFTGGRY